MRNFQHLTPQIILNSKEFFFFFLIGCFDTNPWIKFTIENRLTKGGWLENLYTHT